MKTKLAVVGALVITSSVGFGAAARASSLIQVPAPASHATGVAVQVGKLVGVGTTGATAGQSGASATAAPLTIAGKPVLAGVQNVTKSGSGNAFDTGATPLGRVTVAPWSTSVGPNSASSSSALATASLNGVGDIAVAPSSSLATWSPGMSSGKAISDGAVLHFGDTTIKVLHAESDSSGHGQTYLVQISDMIIGRTDSSGCLLDLGPVATLGCLQVLGGANTAAAVAQALPGVGGPLGNVVAATAAGGAGKVVPASVLGASITKAATETARSPLARTGQDILELTAFAMLLMIAGATAMFASNNRKAIAIPAEARH